MLEPDTIDETIEALKLFDHDKDGKIEVTELRWAMTKLGDSLEDSAVDGMISELDPEKTGLVDIMALAKVTHNVKEEKEKGDKGGKKDTGKKKWDPDMNFTNLLEQFTKNEQNYVIVNWD